ncbi:hypothetical protein EV401DRAFT_2035537 [Pisolithus croceorrhizus]|nr:hypothetical protein EV401DRAFT_2035537 [Pisolithus croceorrhizus]
MRDYSLVTSVVECSGCSLTNDFKTRIEKQTRWYPKMWQGHVRDTMTNLQTVTPLYTIATPWVWYQGEPNRRVTSEYRKIRELFNVIKSYPPAHHRKLREKAVEFFEVIFGVKHLESLVGNVAFFEHLPSFSSKHRGLNATLLDENVSGLPNDSLKPLEESRSEKLVMELVEAMRGVTNHRDSKWLLAVKRSASMVQKITETLALEFLVDIYRAFPTKAEALNSFAERRKLNYHIFDHIQPLVKEVEDLHVKYYAIKDSSEQLALEEDIVGKILEVFHHGISKEIQYILAKVVHDALHYETTDSSVDLPEKEVRFECLKITGEFFQDACSEVPHDCTAHLRRWVL